MAPDIILFTYDISVFGRKMDWYLTLRGLKYIQCVQKNRLPRPDLEELGVKYRRIPILAIGRDIYCDTRLIIAKLEQLFPENPLGSKSAFDKGVEYLLENWVIDGGPFWRTAGLIPTNCDVMNDQKWVEDREEMVGAKFDKEARAVVRPESLVHSRMYFNMIENSLMADGRKYILNTPAPTLADIHVLWFLDWTLQEKMDMVRALEKDVISKDLFPHTFAWVDRFRQFISSLEKKQGKAEILSGKDTVDRILSGKDTVDRILASDFFEKEGVVDAGDPLKLKKGQMVEVWPTDSGFNHHDQGELVALSVNEVVVLSKVPNGNGKLRLHFPRINFRIKPVADARL